MVTSVPNFSAAREEQPVEGTKNTQRPQNTGDEFFAGFVLYRKMSKCFVVLRKMLSMAFTAIICSKMPFIVVSLVPQLEATSVSKAGSQRRPDLPKWPQSPW